MHRVAQGGRQRDVAEAQQAQAPAQTRTEARR
jgi:hypothetical protein